MTVEYCKQISGNRPEYLDVKFFEEVLENGLHQLNVKVDKVYIEMGSGAGENYCSQIYRVKLSYKRDGNNGKGEVISVIVKSLPRSEGTQFLEDLQVFHKEKIFYTNVLPRMEVLMDTANKKFGPSLYHSLEEPVNTLVFEDLRVCKYEMASRENGLDEAHCRMVMQKLGQFHAISMVLAKKDPEYVNSFRSGMLAKVGLEKDNAMLMLFFGNNIQALADVCQKWKGYEGIHEKILKYKSNFKENLIRSQEPIAGEVCVLNHGDLWVNNILFKYDSTRKLQDAIFVDFQLSVYGSPGIDLNYFLNTSVQLDVLKEKREELIREYYELLSDTLERHGYAPIPTYEEIRLEVQRRELFGFFANYAIFPAVSLDKAESSDNHLENFLDEEFARNKVKVMFSSRRLEETMRFTLKRFDELGILD